MVTQTIEEHDIPPLTGKHQKRQRSSNSNLAKRTCIKYDYKRAKESVLADWAGEVPCFPDRQFEHTFRIKCHMVDTIINHLAHRDKFWIKTVCRAGEEIINPYVKFLCTLKVLCYGISGGAFIDYHQFCETTARRCVHHLTRGLVNCRALSEIYPRKPLKADACKVTGMHGKSHKMPGVLGIIGCH
jgi:hypothetical protein